MNVPPSALASDLLKMVNLASMCDIEIETASGKLYANKVILNARIYGFIEKFLNGDPKAKGTSF